MRLGALVRLRHQPMDSEVTRHQDEHEDRNRDRKPPTPMFQR